jgi:hypothetical protein
MPEHPDPDDDLAGLRIYEGDELIFDYDDPTTYTVLDRRTSCGSSPSCSSSKPATWQSDPGTAGGSQPSGRRVAGR